MKKKILKPAAALVSVVLAAVIVFTAVFNSKLEAEAADTFLGIQNLITKTSQQYEATKKKYTILEIVPDRSASLIGYLFDGYEPALSQWDDTRMRWIGWKERLSECADVTARRTLVEDLKVDLKAFYTQNNITNYPVSYLDDAYEESDTPQDGYELIEFPDVRKTGWFKKMASTGNGYRIIFDPYPYNSVQGITYYRVAEGGDVLIDDSNKDSIDDSEMIYKKETDPTTGAEYYIYYGNWGDLSGQETGNMNLGLLNASESGTDPNESLQNGENNETAGETVSDNTTQPSVSENNNSQPEEGNTEENGYTVASVRVDLPVLMAEPGATVSGNAGVAALGYYLVTFEKIPADTMPNTGDIVYITDDSSITYSGSGDYEFVEGAELLGGQAYSLLRDGIYVKNAFKNNEWFRRFVLNMTEDEYDDFPVEVISYTPSELETARANGSFPDFDFLFINSGKTAGWTYSQTYESSAKYGGDITEAVGLELFARVQNNLAPCIVDGNILFVHTDINSTVVSADSTRKNLEIYKLCAAFCQESLDGLDYGAATTDALLTTLANGSGDGNFTTGHIYCHTGQPSIINNDFSEFTIYRAGGEVPDGFERVLDEIELENLYRESDTSGAYSKLPTDISQALVIRHIMNYQNRRNAQAKENIRVLEIQPALTTKAELDINQVKKWAPNVRSVDTTIMTTAEFIGKIDTLNDKYDLIYIGTSREHMNVVNGETVFNDSDMNGLIYYNIGDLRVVGGMMSGLLDTEYKDKNRDDWTYQYNFVRYGGNDITKEKMNDLLAFLDGSYPVIVSDDFMKAPVTVCKDADWGGYNVELRVGEYTTDQMRALGIADNDISSVRVKDGYKLTGYDDDNFVTEIGSWTADDNFTGDGGINGNDTISSLRVEKIGDAVQTIDEYRIDNCTYIYEFVQTALNRQYTNFYVKGDIGNDSELFQFYLNRPKASMVAVSVNGSREVSTQNDAYYILPDASGKYNYRYSFTIQNEGAASLDTKYKCNFYIDVNADGKFSVDEAVTDIVITQNGNRVGTNELYAGREYVLTREIHDEYAGVLPWKVEIAQVNNANIYTSKTGFTKLQGLEKQIINICQIAKTDDANQIIDLEAEIANENSPFHILIYGGYDAADNYYNGIVDDFEIKVNCISAGEFEDIYYGRNGNTANPNYLDNYNMLILGFSDMYSDFSGDESTGPMSEIVRFINSGKSVLLSHDTTSFFNNPMKGGAQSGYLYRSGGEDDPYNNLYNRDVGFRNAVTLNKYVRPLVGMDRYGIQASSVLQKGNVLFENTDDFNSVVSSGKDVAYKHRSNKTETVAEVQGYTYQLINAKDKTFQLGANNNFGSPVLNQQIYSYPWYYLFENAADAAKVLGTGTDFVNTYRNIRYDKVYYEENVAYAETEISYGELAADGNWNGSDNGYVDDLLVTQVNSGQITEYPYKIAESFEVARTHGQYYELDYTADDDMDGQSDLVVWYCLGARNSDTCTETIYSQSPNDVRNNYYIYNKGNITYTGMGHSAGYNVEKYTWEEAKLFINTMVAAYNAGIKSPVITVREGKGADAPKQTVLYRYYDGDFALDSADEEVYFTVRDINFAKGSRRLSVSFCYDAADGDRTIEVDDVLRTVRTLECSIYNAADGTKVNADELQSGGIYYIKVPKEVLDNCERGLSLYFEAKSIITSKSGTIITDSAYATLDVLQTYLFDLN